MPALELDNGKCIGETVTIWEYLEEKNPKPALIGATAEDRAETRQWQRRVEQDIPENLYNGFRFCRRVGVVQKSRAVRTGAPRRASSGSRGARLKWLDGLIEGREFIVPNRFTIADIILYGALDFGPGVGQPLDPSFVERERMVQAGR